MFFNQRYERDMYEESKKRREQQREENLANGTQYQRTIFRLFDGGTVEVGNKTGMLECEFLAGGKDVKIICRTAESDFRFFESKNSYENKVRMLIHDEIRDSGYNTYPFISFRYY